MTGGDWREDPGAGRGGAVGQGEARTDRDEARIPK